MLKYSVKKTGHYQGHRDSIFKLLKTNQEGSFLSASSDGMIVEWNTSKPDEGKLVAKHQGSVYSMCYHAELDFIYSGENYSGIHLIDNKNHKELRSAKITDTGIFDIAFFGDYLLVATADGVLHVLDKLDLSVFSKFRISDNSLRSLFVNHQKKELIIGSSDGKIYVLSLDDFKLLHAFEAHSSSVFKVICDPEFNYLYSVGRDARLKRWSLKDGFELQNEVIAHMFAIKDLVFNPTDSNQFATSSMDKTIKVWEAEKVSLKKVIDKSRYQSHGNSINSLLWLDDEQNTLVTAGDDKQIITWKIERELAV
ncbi:MAG: WD40 repeat domain-containing protein [Cytophagales bacterium]